MKRWILYWILVLFGLNSYAVLPEVTLQDMNGKNIPVASLSQTGKPVIISFFATWCKPCMRELAAMNEVYADWQEETDVTIYIVSVDHAQDIHKVKPLVNGNGWDFEVLLDPNGTFKRAMNVQSIPHMFILNSKGEIVYNHVGYTEGDETEIKKYLH